MWWAHKGEKYEDRSIEIPWVESLLVAQNSGHYLTQCTVILSSSSKLGRNYYKAAPTLIIVTSQECSQKVEKWKVRGMI